jgi:hypothetical protein
MSVMKIDDEDSIFSPIFITPSLSLFMTPYAACNLMPRCHEQTLAQDRVRYGLC